MSFADLQERAKHVWGCFRVDFDSESSIAYRARVASWPFVQGTGAGRTLDEACARAVKQFDRRYAQVEFATDDELRQI